VCKYEEDSSASGLCLWTSESDQRGQLVSATMGKELLYHERGGLHPLERAPKKVKTTPKRPAPPGLPMESEEDPESWEGVAGLEESSEGESDVRRKRVRKADPPLTIWSSRERAIRSRPGYELGQQGGQKCPTAGGPPQGAFVESGVVPKEELGATAQDREAENGAGSRLLGETQGLLNRVLSTARGDSSNAGGAMQGLENGESVPLEVTPRGESLANEERPDKVSSKMT
jgi:hypothetical protein